MFCSVYDCGPLSNPDNGTVEFTLTTFGAIAVFSCDEGFNLTGNNDEDYRECLFGGWDGEDPTCESMFKQALLLCYFLFCCFQLLIVIYYRLFKMALLIIVDLYSGKLQLILVILDTT